MDQVIGYRTYQCQFPGCRQHGISHTVRSIAEGPFLTFHSDIRCICGAAPCLLDEQYGSLVESAVRMSDDEIVQALIGLADSKG